MQPALSRYIAICPIGSIDKVILVHIAERILTRCGLVCEISQSMENPQYAYNEARGQYDSKLILSHLSEYRSDDALRVMGVAHVDLYVPILKYVFGLAHVDGRCSLISLHRLYPEFYDKQADTDILLARVEKTAIHELGHTFGLTHCRDKRCVMFSSTKIENTDSKEADFCPSCYDLFRWNIDKIHS